MSDEDFHVDIVEQGAEVRARLVGTLDAASLPTFLGALEPLAAVARRVVLDCGALEFCDSSGLRGIIVVRNTVGPAGRVVLVDASDGLRHILEITGLTNLLDAGTAPPVEP